MSKAKPDILSITEVLAGVRKDFVETRETMSEKAAAGEAISLILQRLEEAGYAVKRRGVLRQILTITARASFVRLLGTLLHQVKQDGRAQEGPAFDERELTDEELGDILDTVLEAVEIFPASRVVRGRLRSFPDTESYWIEPFDGGPDLRLQDLFPPDAKEVELAIAGEWGEEGP